MRKFILIATALPLVLLTACSDWLDVGPSNNTSRDDLFKDGEGFQIALNGIYQELSEGALYGRELTWGMVSAMGQDYNSEEKSTLSDKYKYSAKHDYTNIALEATIDNIWSQMYNAVANCNSLIQAFDEFANPGMFEFREKESNVILGEAYALRAMIHFDLMRLFAPAPVVADASKKYLSYNAVYPTKVGMPITQKEYLNNVIEDFKRGKDLTATMDTLPDYRGFAFGSNWYTRLEGTGGVSNFFKFRSTRLNYYAITAMLARAYLYAGDKTKAYEQIKELYDLMNNNYQFKSPHNFTASYMLNKTEIGDRSLKSINDIFFALHNTNEINIVSEYMKGRKLPLRDVEGWFADTPSDLRKLYMIYPVEGVGDMSIKWYESQNNTIARTQHPLLPIFRTAEIYYIMAECAYDIDPDISQKCFVALKSGRNTRQNIDISTKELLMKTIIDDTRREYLTEGQTFFLYKRLNITNGYMPIGAKLNYVLPIPASNSVF